MSATFFDPQPLKEDELLSELRLLSERMSWSWAIGPVFCVLLVKLCFSYISGCVFLTV